MRPNPIKPRLAAGGCAFGTMTFEFFTPGYPAICREAGAEFILYDMEHSGVTIETLKGQIAACRGIGLTPMVRVPALQYHFIARRFKGCHPPFSVSQLARKVDHVLEPLVA